MNREQTIEYLTDPIYRMLRSYCGERISRLSFTRTAASACAKVAVDALAAQPSDDLEEAALKLADCIEFGLDLSDEHTLREAGYAVVNLSRSASVFREVIEAVRTLRAALSADKEAKT